MLYKRLRFIYFKSGISNFDKSMPIAHVFAESQRLNRHQKRQPSRQSWWGLNRNFVCNRVCLLDIKHFTIHVKYLSISLCITITNLGYFILFLFLVKAVKIPNI